MIRTPHRCGRLAAAGAGGVSERFEGALLAVDLAVGACGFLPVALDLRALLAAGRRRGLRFGVALYFSFPAKGTCFYGSPPRSAGNGCGPGRGWLCLHRGRVDKRRDGCGGFSFPVDKSDMSIQRTGPDPRVESGFYIPRVDPKDQSSAAVGRCTPPRCQL